MRICLLYEILQPSLKIMAVKTKQGAWGSLQYIEAIPKKTRQGNGKHTKYAATSRNTGKKRYRGQGK